MFRLEELASELRDAVADLDPATYDGRDAARLTKVAADVEKLGATAKILLARRAAETRGWVGTSSAASSDQWLAQISGCSDGAARDALATADRVAALPATEAKLRDGTLSVNQASLVSQGASVDPAAEPVLLRLAKRGEYRNLRSEKERVIAAATDAEEAQRRARRDRHLRTWTRGVETHGAFSGPTSEVDALLRALEPMRLSHGLLELVLHDGKDVQAIVTKTRHVPDALKIAIEERDERCRIRGCDATQHLQRHHIDEFAEHHITSYEVLGWICADDHDLVTHCGYTIEVHDDGSWTLHPPDEQRDTDAA